MRRAVVSQLGSPLAIAVESGVTPSPAPGEVLIRVRAAALGFVDNLIVQGKYQIKPATPYVPGGEMAGVVDALGQGVTTVAIGDSVAVWQFGGGLADFAVAPADSLVKLPTGLDPGVAASAYVDYLTAAYALDVRGQLTAGETVLVLGAAGGVGQAAIQLAAAEGARVIAVVSSEAKAATATERGASTVIVHPSGDKPLREHLRDLGLDGKLDVIVDTVGGDAFESLFRSLAKGGRHLVIGFASGVIPKLPANLALLKSASLVGVDLRHFVEGTPARAAALAAALFQRFHDGRLTPPARVNFTLAEAGQAFEALADRGRQGKVVVQP